MGLTPKITGNHRTLKDKIYALSKVVVGDLGESRKENESFDISADYQALTRLIDLYL